MGRQSKYVNRRQASNFLQAARFAEEIGRPLNLLVTINMEQLGCPADQVSADFERLRDNHFTRWLRYTSKTSQPAYTWTIENGEVNLTHVHWVVHVPSHLREAFEKKLPEWVAKVIGGSFQHVDGAIRVKKAGNPKTLGSYLMKGINPKCATFYKIRPKNQGLVYGKRCGISASLGPKARRLHLAKQAATRQTVTTREPRTVAPAYLGGMSA